MPESVSCEEGFPRKNCSKHSLYIKRRDTNSCLQQKQQQCRLEQSVFSQTKKMTYISILLWLLMKTASANPKFNVALGGFATQIDTYNELGAASNAIDGKRDNVYYHDSCTHTFTTTDPWWRLDLLETYTISSVTVVNRGDCCADRLDGAQVCIGNSLENNGNDNPVVATLLSSRGNTQTLTFTEPVEGRYVNVFLPGTNKYLTLCEVEVYGSKDEVNLALGGEATQGNTYDALGAASNAIDGKRDSVYGHKSCTHTLETTDPWWRVDLRESCMITSITITNRRDCCAQRLDSAQIRIGNSLDNNGNSNPIVATVSHIAGGRSQTFVLPRAVEGRYVNIFLPGMNKILTLCEVEVHGLKQEGKPPAPEDEKGHK
ncbi:hypothetical protein WMY93_031295 [Mugilogobius chulae]|uniref:Fucolectin tachylectin-4 pentraxin-1 domain-containing protein n=1 Tax=Mugilogobius chulae TaxID=88201 RepID=A0AAW0MEE8_9GOBI